MAVVGASRRPGAIGRQVVANLVESGFQGPVYPVNSKSDVVLSMPTYPTVSKIPGPVDLAVLCVPAPEVVKVARECGKKGVKGLVVITAGFKEIGGEGERREAELREVARHYGMRIVGPNCMGVINTEPDVCLDASFAATRTPAGAVAMVSQSGALGEAILADASAAGLGVSMFASVGNRADVTAADLIEYWADIDSVRIVLLYVESLGDPAKFVEVARRVGRTKPILAVKSGRSAAGAAAAGSHTGSVAGADVAADTLFQQCGVLRVESFREMFALAAALLHQRLPQGPRIAVVTNAGGPGILATDALDGAGLEVPELTPRTKAALVRALPVEASVRNPVDLIASADAERYRRALRLVVRDPNVDALIVLFVSPIMIDAEAVAAAIVEEAATDKPLLVCLMGRQRGREAQELLRRSGVPVFRYPEDAARTMRSLCRRARMLERESKPLPRLRVDRDAAAAVLDRAAPGWLAVEDAEAVLAAYGVPFAPSRRVTTPGDAVGASHELGFPVVLKAEARSLVHKSELHAVVNGLRNGDEVYRAAEDLRRRLARRFRGLRLLVQKRAPGHREILIGMTRDPRYGPLFAVGLGGTHVEVLRDVAFRIAPLDGGDPAEMFAQLKGAPLLGRFRGDPPADVALACEIVLRLQRLVLDFPLIEEVEINPFILAEPGGESLAVDARLRLQG
ncbi:MAG: acetate--CoA ligase family protein [Planctomycetes bacterium]|nr:acetate--CoA ligase family protein [Planctomycetota bacterium]